MVTDPIADFLVRLRNAGLSRRESVTMPASKATVTLAYKNGRPVISGAKRISKPSRRMYMGVRDIKPVKRGHGLLVLSTPAGLVTGKEAQVKRVGGEALFEIW